MYLLIYDKSIKFNYYVFKLTHEVCLKWARIYKITFASKKYKLIYLIRRLRRFNIKIIINLRDIIIESKINIRVLRLHVNNKLR